jgi:hypothetical protein
MASMNECFNQIIEEALREYTKLGKENNPQSMCIVIQAPKVLGQTMLPPIILDVGLVKDTEHTYAMISRIYTIDISDEAVDAMMSQLLTMKQLFQEYLEEADEDEHEEDAQID